MLWFLLFGLLGYFIYKVYRFYWFRSLQQKIIRFKGKPYKQLSKANQKKLRGFVEAALNADLLLDDDTNKIVGEVYNDIQQEAFYRQGGFGLHEISRDRSDR
ncbi:hypothetical protein [Lyngbya confervoides]|uniref:Uncharacterized protein n=1 Tax=Lyngbya confervoides BDU141951 TaxID=1574623 RepID=A0ABD4T0B3_9CYAN|nr:hypothetical protein [Lyngbya confervoides]MCM1982074.1 hypothetical protein [Lyngbya confervoides BDU141951]